MIKPLPLVCRAVLLQSLGASKRAAPKSAQNIWLKSENPLISLQSLFDEKVSVLFSCPCFAALQRACGPCAPQLSLSGTEGRLGCARSTV